MAGLPVHTSQLSALHERALAAEGDERRKIDDELAPLLQASGYTYFESREVFEAIVAAGIPYWTTGVDGGRWWMVRFYMYGSRVVWAPQHAIVTIRNLREMFELRGAEAGLFLRARGDSSEVAAALEAAHRLGGTPAMMQLAEELLR